MPANTHTAEALTNEALTDAVPEPVLELDAHRRAMAEIGFQVNALLGIPRHTSITAEELQARQVANGIRAEDNGATRELLKMRYGDDYEQE